MTISIGSKDLATLMAGGSIPLQGPTPVPPPTPPTPPTPPPVTGKYGNHPGVYAMSVDINNDPVGEANEIACLAAAIKANPSLAKIIKGYSIYRDWRTIQPTSKGVYVTSSIDTTFANLQAALPGMALDIQMRPYANWIQPFGANAGQSILPAYIFNGAKATYGNPSVGGNGAGWGLVAYQAAAGNTAARYIMVTAALWNANTMAEWTAAMAAIAAKYASNPLIEGVKDFSPTEMCNFAGSPTTPTDYSGANLKANWISRCAALAQIKGPLVGLMPGFLPSGWAMADLYPVVAAMAANNIGFSCTDVLNKSSGQDLTYAQHMLLGQIDVPSGGNNVWVASGPSLLGKGSSSWPTVQPEDWEDTDANANSAAQVTAIMKICYTTLQADHVSIAMASETDFNLKDFYSASAGNGYIVNGLLAAGGIPGV